MAKKIFFVGLCLLTFVLAACREPTPVYTAFQHENHVDVYYTIDAGTNWQHTITLRVKYPKPGTYKEIFSLGPSEPANYLSRDTSLVPTLRTFTAKEGSMEDVFTQYDWPVALNVGITTTQGQSDSVETYPYGAREI